MSLHWIEDTLDIGKKVELEGCQKRLFKLRVYGDSKIECTHLGLLQFEASYMEKVIIGRPLIAGKVAVYSGHFLSLYVFIFALLTLLGVEIVRSQPYHS